MNNKLASNVRENGMNYIFNNVIDTNNLIRIDTGKYVFPVMVDGNKYFCEIDFIAKKEDYTINYDVSKYAEKVSRMEKAQKELTERKQKKATKTATAKTAKTAETAKTETAEMKTAETATATAETENK